MRVKVGSYAFRETIRKGIAKHLGNTTLEKHLKRSTDGLRI